MFICDKMWINEWTRSAGDFEEIYGPDEYDEGEPQAGLWDAILTCFFIDTVRIVFSAYFHLHSECYTGQEYCELPPHHPSQIST